MTRNPEPQKFHKGGTILSVKGIKNITFEHNVTIRVIDKITNQIVQEHKGHNHATNSMLMGIAHYLIGDGVLNQGSNMLDTYIPKYISLGTMGLRNQESDEAGLPAGIGISSGDDVIRFQEYMSQRPGYGADGYDPNENHNRPYLGLGPKFDRISGITTNCELISSTFPRAMIAHREIIPETRAELPETIDIVYTAMISTGALAQFRDPDKGYVFISEVGLWSSKIYKENTAQNGLLAAYRLIPSDSKYYDMTIPENRLKLKQSIIKVNTNQIVQVIWKIQLGSKEQFVGV